MWLKAEVVQLVLLLSTLQNVRLYPKNLYNLADVISVEIFLQLFECILVNSRK